MSTYHILLYCQLTHPSAMPARETFQAMRGQASLGKLEGKPFDMPRRDRKLNLLNERSVWELTCLDLNKNKPVPEN